MREIAAIPPEKWVSWRRHKVEEGETLSAIAKRYRVSPAEVADANDLPAGAPLEEGQKLIIPAAERSEGRHRQVDSIPGAPHGHGRHRLPTSSM